MVTMMKPSSLPNVLEFLLQEDTGLTNSVLRANSGGHSMTVLNAACDWCCGDRGKIIEILLAHGANPFVKDDSDLDQCGDRYSCEA
jgi:hypothetical protein